MAYGLAQTKKSYSEMDTAIEKLTGGSNPGIASILDPKHCYRTSLAKAFAQAQSHYKPKTPSKIWFLIVIEEGEKNIGD
jgi:hypothetical protein